MPAFGSPAAQVDDIAIFRYRLPLVARVTLGRRATDSRDGVCLRLRSGQEYGWGDAAPLEGFSAESPTDVAASLQALRSELPLAGHRLLERAAAPSARFAIDTALREIAARQASEPALVASASIRRETIPMSGLRGDVTSATGPDVVDPAGRAEVVKFKVGRESPEREAARVRAELEAMGGAVGIRFDANRRWSVAQSSSFLTMVRDLPIDYFEEPATNPRDAERIAGMGISVALDETVVALAATARDNGAALYRRVHEFVPSTSVLVVKPSLIGAWDVTLALAAAAIENECRVVLSSAYESGLGVRALVAIAAQLNEVEAAGFGTYARIAEDILRPRLSLASTAANVRSVCSLDREVVTSKLTAWR